MHSDALVEAAIRPLLPFLTPAAFEIMVNRPDEVWVDSQTGVHQHTIAFSATAAENLLHHLAASRFKKSGVNYPILQDTWVNPTTGQAWRVTGVLPPVTKQVAFNFRRLNATPLTSEQLFASQYFEKEKLAVEQVATRTGKGMDNLKGEGTATKECSLLPHRYSRIIKAIEGKRNIVISGATGSSKTQFLNWCLSQMATDERILTIEDTSELVLTQPNHVQLYYPDDKTQSECPVDANRLLKVVLRMKPDRIIMGEVRGEELVTMLDQANTGHPGTIMTIHANSPAQAKYRMRDILLKVYPMQSAAMLDMSIDAVVDMIVQVKRQGDHFFVDAIWEKGEAVNGA
jgi:Flp pilus assembly CpaF family ATPase